MRKNDRVGEKLKRMKEKFECERVKEVNAREQEVNKRARNK